MIVRRVYLRPSAGMFRRIARRNGHRPAWYYFAEGPFGLGGGKTARAAIHDARKRRV